MPTNSLIAIVDDDASVRRAIASLLQSMGYWTVAFASAQDYLASSDCMKSACLITDMHMPGLSGKDLLRRLAERGLDIPAIIVTAQAEAAWLMQETALGPCPVLKKPFDPALLMTCVASVLAGKGRADRP